MDNRRLVRIILIVASIGLMFASSGLDGSYLSRAMGPWFGYSLNTVSDIVSEVLMYAFARIRQTARKGSKPWKLSWILLAVNVFMVAYAWFFGWRELRLTLPAIEGDAAKWVAPVMAGFVPVGILGAGIAQALIDGKFDASGDQQSTDDDQPTTTKRKKTATIDHWRTIRAEAVPSGVEVTAADVQRLLSKHGFAPAKPSTARRWTKET